MSTVKSKKLQVGTDASASNNFTIYQPATPDGTLRIGVGNADSPTEVARFDATGMISGGATPDALSTATSSTSQPSYSVRAWINWNGNIGGTIKGSGGVSSFSRGGAGDYDIFWSVTLDDANYAVTCCSGEQRVDRGLSSNGLATNKATIVYEDTSGTRVDGGDLCIMMIR